MKDIKCSQCGCTDFYESSRTLLQEQWTEVWPEYGNCGTYKPTIQVYFCKRCGHVDLFVTDDYKNEYEENHKRYLEHNKNLKIFEENKKSEIERLENEIKKLEEIIQDDNNSVKLVNESKEKLPQVKKQLEKVKNSKFEDKE